jgi:ABC-type lipoprotein export system ATPase subunit
LIDEGTSEGSKEQVVKTVVDLTSISKEYAASGQTVRALESITFTVNEREVVAIIGPSGAGKTTLLNLIAGLETPSAGEVRAFECVLLQNPTATLPVAH